MRTHCGGHIGARDAFLGEQTGKHLLRTQNVSERNQKHFCVSDTNFVSVRNVVRAANRETFVSTTMCPQHCVLVCHHLNITGFNMDWQRDCK